MQELKAMLQSMQKMPLGRWPGSCSGMPIISTKIIQKLVALRQTDELAPVLGDYVDYLRAAAYHGDQNHDAVIKALEGFDQKYPDSLLIHDSSLLYSDALMSTGSPQKAAAYLEKHRQPVHADIELALAHAYRSAGQDAKAAEILRH